MKMHKVKKQGYVAMNLELEISTATVSTNVYPKRKQFDSNGGTIGRGNECDLSLPCDENVISRKHADIVCVEDQFFVHDSSANGVYLNGNEEPVGRNESAAIKNGDTIKIGHYCLKVSINEPVEISLVPPPPPELKPLSKKSESIDLASLSDNFSPPASFIPEDWNSDLIFQNDGDSAASNPVKKAIAAANVNGRSGVPDFNGQQTKLIRQLLIGLGAEKSVSADEVTPEMMQLVGKVLRVAIGCSIKNHKLQQEVCNTLCIHEDVVNKSFNVDIPAELNSSDAMINILFDQYHPQQKALPGVIAQRHKEAVESQKSILDLITYTFKRVKADLAPKNVETAYQKQQQAREKKNIINKISNQFGEDANKWNFLQKNWNELCEKTVTGIRMHFENKVRSRSNKRNDSKSSAGTKT
jgi:predicted component of type VI protein secretion system